MGDKSKLFEFEERMGRAQLADFLRGLGDRVAEGKFGGSLGRFSFAEDFQVGEAEVEVEMKAKSPDKGGEREFRLEVKWRPPCALDEVPQKKRGGCCGRSKKK